MTLYIYIYVCVCVCLIFFSLCLFLDFRAPTQARSIIRRFIALDSIDTIIIDEAVRQSILTTFDQYLQSAKADKLKVHTTLPQVLDCWWSCGSTPRQMLHTLMKRRGGRQQLAGLRWWLVGQMRAFMYVCMYVCM